MSPDEENPEQDREPPRQIAPAQPPEEPDHEPLYDPAPPAAEPPAEPARYESVPQPPTYDPPRRDQPLFGDAEIPLPQSTPRRTDRQRARDARSNLDLDLNRIKRRKRFGLFNTLISVVFIAFVLIPVTWAGAYLFFDPPSTFLMLQRAAEGQTIRHYPVPLERISPHVVRAVIAAEDGNFCTHDGFDVEAIQRALRSNARGGNVRGGSTVSQQTAKNLFLWPERSWVRKGFETYFTALIEFMWPKERIMEAYLNAAEWGDGNFGIEAAARARFGVSAEDLTPLQAARLAAVLPNPNRWRADRPGPYVRSRSAMLVGRARVVRTEGLAGCVLESDQRN
ncbi:MAG: monofunctional biosynthetic peptidoglycan transglycosylase [Phycisphaerales bacterium]|nr:monofunctional biosynthetic peptidoglycan transglycosylase [Hyphomonadaceae bacterium]